jgi:hypothetical protein
VHSATVVPRMLATFAQRRVTGFLLVTAIACPVLAACSPGADYPSLFPSVHDIPPPRTDTVLDSNQVQQATEDLISARDRLSAEGQEAHGKNSTSSAAKSTAKFTAKSAAKSAANSAGKSSADRSSADKSSADKPSTHAAAGPAAARKQSGIPVSAGTLGTDAGETAGTETK